MLGLHPFSMSMSMTSTAAKGTRFGGCVRIARFFLGCLPGDLEEGRDEEYGETERGSGGVRGSERVREEAPTVSLQRRIVDEVEAKVVYRVERLPIHNR